MQAGAASVCAVLDMLAAALEQMRSAEVATLGDSIFSGLLQVLDLRRVSASGWQRCEVHSGDSRALS